MRIRRWTTSPAACRHILVKHNVGLEEVDEVMCAAPRVLRGADRDGERRYLAIGRTIAGRRLRVVFRMVGDTAQVITAFEEGH